ncbi:MAG: hypothetical protein PHV82_12115 [Victivallaceae bacterium]|nr:hypothetical protein [Victivallaceae bacterium]
MQGVGVVLGDKIDYDFSLDSDAGCFHIDIRGQIANMGKSSLPDDPDLPGDPDAICALAAGRVFLRLLRSDDFLAFRDFLIERHLEKIDLSCSDKCWS